MNYLKGPYRTSLRGQGRAPTRPHSRSWAVAIQKPIDASDVAVMRGRLRRRGRRRWSGQLSERLAIGAGVLSSKGSKRERETLRSRARYVFAMRYRESQSLQKYTSFRLQHEYGLSHDHSLKRLF